MTELCDLFNVSMNTVRRDVAELRRRGDVEKVYGGVCAVENNGSVLRPFTERQTIADAAKRAICREAAKLLEDGDVVFVDSGTTMVHLVDNLASRQELTIITNNLALVQQAIPYDNLRMIVLPGQLRRKTNSLTGMETVRALRQYNIRKAFLAATGSTLTGVTNSSPQEYEIKRTALECLSLIHISWNSSRVVGISASRFSSQVPLYTTGRWNTLPEATAGIPYCMPSTAA